jgi:hypothetical protein
MLKLLLSLLLFSALWGNAQETKLKFHQQLYLEPNVGVGFFHSIHNNIYETPNNYPSFNGSLGLNFRNSFMKTGIDFNYFFPLSLSSFRFQTSWNFHQFLNDNPSENYFCGPIMGVGYYDHPKYLGFTYFTIGLDNYFHNFHFAIKYDILETRGHYSYMKKANMVYLELGYAIHLGKKNKKTQE